MVSIFGKIHHARKNKIHRSQAASGCTFFIAQTFGKYKACSNFIIGLEPVESVLEGAEFLAKHGIVPIASVWIPFGRRVNGFMQAPPLPYIQAVKEGNAFLRSIAIYKYSLP